MTTIGAIHVRIGVQNKPLLYVAAAFELLDNGRGGAFHRVANRLVDRCLLVETIVHDG